MPEITREPPPLPTYTLTLSIGACHWDTLARRLREEADHIAEHGPECRACWGGAGTHGHVQIEHRPEVTEDAYNAALQAWWERSR